MDVPTEILIVIGEYLDTQSLFRLRRTCRSYYYLLLSIVKHPTFIIEDISSFPHDVEAAIHSSRFGDYNQIKKTHVFLGYDHIDNIAEPNCVEEVQRNIRGLLQEFDGNTAQFLLSFSETIV